MPAKNGPWRIKDDTVQGGAGLVIWSANQGIVALLPTIIADEGKRIGNMDDARLIAAAPELLEAAKLFVAARNNIQLQEAVIEAEAAIAKAEGRTDAT